MNKLILASGSPRRKELLENSGINPEIIPPLNESAPKENEKPWEFVKRVSMEKMNEVKDRHLSDNSYILAADTIVVFKNKILGKPKDKKEWEKFLLMLSGNWHRVYTGYALHCPKKSYSRVIKTQVKFINISEHLLKWYLSTEEGLDKAGGYAIQGKGAVLVEEIRGSFSNVIGLPISKVIRDLEKCSFFNKNIT